MSKQFINESEEMYLETIYLLSKEKDLVRSIDVVNALHYSKPSVSRAVKLLKESGDLTVERGGALRLTPKGLAAAEAVYERHKTITKFFSQFLGVDAETAESDACRIEHIISDESFEKMKQKLAKG